MLKIRKLTKLEILAQEGTIEILEFLQSRSDNSVDGINNEFSNFLRKDQISELIDALDRVWFIQRLRNRVRITEDGIEALLLGKVINGAPLHSVIDKLSLTTRRRFSLLTKNLTGAFFHDLSLYSNPSEVLLCSPWIRLNKMQRQILLRAKKKARLKFRCAVITRIPETSDGSVRSSTWRNQLIDTLNWLLSAGVPVATHPRLHTKLFISDGPNVTAILGSENLTGAENIEIGIRITDEVFVKKLITYWEDTYSSSIPLSQGEISD